MDGVDRAELLFDLAEWTNRLEVTITGWTHESDDHGDASTVRGDVGRDFRFAGRYGAPDQDCKDEQAFHFFLQVIWLVEWRDPAWRALMQAARHSQTGAKSFAFNGSKTAGTVGVLATMSLTSGAPRDNVSLGGWGQGPRMLPLVHLVVAGRVPSR